jgi:WD40 repeat protein
MTRADVDRNLLFGIVALHTGFVTRDQMVIALEAWVRRKSDPFADVLVDQGALETRHRELLEPLVAAHLERHHGVVESSLAAVVSQLPTRPFDTKIDDPDLAASLATLVAHASTMPHTSGSDGSVLAATQRSETARYRVIREHARGGLGVVFLAEDTELNRPVALKEIQQRFADDAVNRARFLTEAEVTGALEHPGVVPVYGLGRYEDGRPFYAMRFIKGDSLRDAIARFHEADKGPKRDHGERALALQTLLRRFLDVCNVIQFAHDRGVLHRDLKPGNVMVGRYGETLVVDWGLAKVTVRPENSVWGEESRPRPGPASSTAETLAGQAIGTPAYMSPEQARGQLDLIGPASDIYSLGATLYCLLTGHAPLEGGEVGSILARVAAGAIPPPRAVNPRVPRALEAVCVKAMALGSQARYASVRALAADLERYLADEPVTAIAEGWSQRLARWGRRHRAAVQAGAIALAVVAVLSAGFLVQLERAYRGERERRIEALVARKHAENAERLALLENRALERQAALLLLDRGVSECEAGRTNRGVLWLARALARVPREETRLRDVIGDNLEAWTRTLPPLTRQLPHDSHVLAMALSPDGTTILSGSWDGKAQLWDAATGQAIGPPWNHPGQVLAVAFSPDGRTVLTGCDDGRARMWNAGSGHLLRRLSGHTLDVRAVAFSADGRTVATGSADRTARLWAAGSGEPIGSPLEHQGEVNAVAFRPDGRLLATACNDHQARLWDATAGKPFGPPLGHETEVRALAFSPDGVFLLTGCEDGTAQFWDVESGYRAGPTFAHNLVVLAVAFSPDGLTVLTGSGDSTARLWDTNTGKPIGPPLEHRGVVSAVAFSPDGQTVATGSWDHSARLWHTAEMQSPGTPLVHRSWVNAVAFSPDGLTAVTGSSDNTARLWDVATSAPLGSPMLHQGPVVAVAFDPSGKILATASEDHTARLWDAATGRPIGPALPHKDNVAVLAFSPLGKTLLTGSADFTARMWDTTRCEPVGAPLEHQGRILAVAFSRDGTSVATGSTDSTARQWDALTGAPLGRPLVHENWVTALTFGPNNRTLLTASWDHSARLWDLQSGQTVTPPMRHKEGIVAVALSPDGRVVLTGGWDRMARLWDAATGIPIGAPLEHKDRVGAVAFSPDGRTAVTASHDRTARRWDASTGKPIGPAFVHNGAIRALTFSPRGNVVLTGSDDYFARLWDIGPGESFREDSGLATHAVHALTGLTLDESGAVQDLDVSSWQASRAAAGSFRWLAGARGRDALPSGTVWHETQIREAVIYDDWFAARWHLARLIAQDALERGHDGPQGQGLLAWLGESPVRDGTAADQGTEAARNDRRDFWARVDAYMADRIFPADPFAK